MPPQQDLFAAVNGYIGTDHELQITPLGSRILQWLRLLAGAILIIVFSLISDRASLSKQIRERIDLFFVPIWIHFRILNPSKCFARGIEQ